MLEDLKKKIFSYLSGSGALNSHISGRVYYIENEKTDPTYPYLVFQFISGNSDRDTGTRYEDITMQVTLYCKTSIEASESGAAADSILDGSEAQIALTNYNVLGIDRISPPRENKTFIGNWQWSADYQIQLEKK